MGDIRWGKTPEKEGWLVELVGDQIPGFIVPPRSKRGGSKEAVRRGGTAREVMEKSRYVVVIEREEVRGDDPIKYFLPTGVGSTF